MAKKKADIKTDDECRPGLIKFELNLMDAVLDQLTPKIKDMEPLPLTEENTRALPEAQGVYQLFHEGQVKYVGKTDAKAGLRVRLTRHVSRLQQRDNIKPEDVQFKAVQIYVLTAMDIETELIDRCGTKKNGWNGSSFGSNDPGRKRETTNKPPKGFDAQFPINIDIAFPFPLKGEQSVYNVLWNLKDALPYCFRYQTTNPESSTGYKTAPEPEYITSSIVIPDRPVSVKELLGMVVHALPNGWQATKFPSHVILYKEATKYAHGEVIQPITPGPTEVLPEAAL